MKEEKYEKRLTTLIKFLLLFLLWKRIYFPRKHSMGKCTLYYYISSKISFSVAGYLKQSSEACRRLTLTRNTWQ